MCLLGVGKGVPRKLPLSIHYWRAGASLPSRPNGAIFIFIYISGVDVCRNVLRNSK